MLSLSPESLSVVAGMIVGSLDHGFRFRAPKDRFSILIDILSPYLALALAGAVANNPEMTRVGGLGALCFTAGYFGMAAARSAFSRL